MDKAAQTVLKKRDSDPMSFAINHVPAHGLTTIEDFNQPLAKTLNEVSIVYPNFNLSSKVSLLNLRQ